MANIWILICCACTDAPLLTVGTAQELDSSCVCGAGIDAIAPDVDQLSTPDSPAAAEVVPKDSETDDLTGADTQLIACPIEPFQDGPTSPPGMSVQTHVNKVFLATHDCAHFEWHGEGPDGQIEGTVGLGNLPGVSLYLFWLGTHRACVSIRDHQNAPVCAEGCREVEVVAPPSWYIELSWTPIDVSSDVFNSMIPVAWLRMEPRDSSTWPAQTPPCTVPTSPTATDPANDWVAPLTSVWQSCALNAIASEGVWDGAHGLGATLACSAPSTGVVYFVAENGAPPAFGSAILQVRVYLDGVLLDTQKATVNAGGSWRAGYVDLSTKTWHACGTL